MFVRVQLKGFTDLDKLAENVGTLEYDVAAALLNRIKARFLRQEAPDGSTWPVSQASLRRKKTGRDGGTLFDSGNLYHSLQVRRIDVNLFGFYTDLPYAVKHQRGIGVVRRVFLGFNKDDANLAADMIRKRIQENFSGR